MLKACKVSVNMHQIDAIGEMFELAKYRFDDDRALRAKFIRRLSIMISSGGAFASGVRPYPH